MITVLCVACLFACLVSAFWCVRACVLSRYRKARLCRCRSSSLPAFCFRFLVLCLSLSGRSLRLLAVVGVVVGTKRESNRLLHIQRYSLTAGKGFAHHVVWLA